MFTTLLESNSARPRMAGQSLLSLALHLALGVGAVHATRRIVTITQPQVIPMGPIAPVDKPPPPAPPTADPGPGSAVLPNDPVFIPPPVAPIDGIPLPPVGEPIDSRRFVVGSPTPPPCIGTCEHGDPGAMQAFQEDLVDEPALVLSQAAPQYPAVLKAAQIEGRVVLQFVVDTLGTVEAKSISVLESAHAGFERSALESILGSHFKPARIRGVAVRQVVRQGVTFRIER